MTIEPAQTVLVRAGLELISLSQPSPALRPSILFIHGGFHGAQCWARSFMPWFASQGFACHAISYREHGENPRTENHRRWRLADYVADVRDALARIDGPVILVGHSLGGTIAQKLARDPRVRALVLLAPSPIGGSNRAAMRMFAAHPAAMARAFATGDFAQALPAFLSFFLSDDASQQDRAELARHCTGLTSRAAVFDAFYRDCPKPAPIGRPVLVVSGRDDWSIPQSRNRKLARAYGGDHIVVPTAHDIMWDAGWALAAADINHWLFQQVAAQD